MRILAILLALAASCVASTLQTVILAGGDDISLAVRADGYSRSASIHIADLSAPQQAVVAASLGWLGSQLPGGESATKIVLERGAAVATAWDETGQPTAWRETLNAAITGQRPGYGERTIAINSEQAPAEIRDGLLALWAALEAGQ